MAEVKLHAEWASPYCCRVIWGLKLKGIPYEYIEEDLFNKSPLLLQINPVHKKVPVLVHGGRPICESMVIIEYLEEKWPQNALLPSDPYERAVARFWIKFLEDKGTAVWRAYGTSSGEEREKAVKEILEMLKTIEEKALGEKKFFGGDKINMVDIAYGLIPHCLGVIEEIIEVRLFEPHRFPRLHTWMKNFKENPTIKENLPDPIKMLPLYKRFREMLLKSV